MNKCYAILFIFKKEMTFLKLILSNRKLSWAPEILYLRVTLDKILTFRKHVKNINSKVIGKINPSDHTPHVDQMQDHSILHPNQIRHDLRLSSLVHLHQNTPPNTSKTKTIPLSNHSLSKLHSHRYTSRPNPDRSPQWKNIYNIQTHPSISNSKTIQT